MTLPSNKWEEALDRILQEHGAEAGEFTHSLKQALTNEVRELVKGTMPEPTSAFDGSEAQVFIIATDQYQANLLKAIDSKQNQSDLTCDEEM